MRHRSLKMQKLYRERRPIVAALFEAHPVCQVPDCTRRSTDPHEPLTRGRGGSITDPDNILVICRQHHREITDEEPAWAYELGFLRHSWEGSQRASGEGEHAETPRSA